MFINCPYDRQYVPLLRVIIYTLSRCGFRPRIALERFNSAEVRLQKIIELIEHSLLSIHDLSRVRTKSKKDFARLNMPFELGIDLGCRKFHGNPIYQNKRMLVLEAEPFTTQKALSDLSFADCKTYHGSGEELCFALRDWFTELGYSDVPPGSLVWDDYNAFWSTLLAHLTELGYKKRDIDRLTMPEYMQWINKKWKEFSATWEPGE